MGLCLLVVISVVQADVKFSGYLQARYNIEDAGPDEFDLRRVRLKAAGPVNDKGTKAKVQIDMGKLDDDGGDVELKDAILTHPLGDQWTARFGFSDMMFGFEVPYSSSKRLPFERSRICAKKLFPGEKDNGIYLFFEPEREGQPEFVIGYSNGLRKWRTSEEDEQADALVARVQWPLPRKSPAGVSYMTADRTNDGSNYSVDVVGAHIRWNGPRGFNFQGEYYDGDHLDYRHGQLNDIDGWYAQFEYQPCESQADLAPKNESRLKVTIWGIWTQGRAV